MQQVHEKYLKKHPNSDWHYDLRIRYLPTTFRELYEKDKVTFHYYYDQVNYIHLFLCYSVCIKILWAWGTMNSYNLNRCQHMAHFHAIFSLSLNFVINDYVYCYKFILCYNLHQDEWYFKFTNMLIFKLTLLFAVVFLFIIFFSVLMYFILLLIIPTELWLWDLVIQTKTF